MLDKKSIFVLKALSKMAESNAYKVVTTEEIMANLTQKTQFDNEGIRQIVDFLEKQEYINIKFSEENTFCYSLLPKARIFLEQETGNGKVHKAKKANFSILNYVFTAIAAFLGTMIALIIFFSFL